jgi:hypothetical protein
MQSNINHMTAARQPARGRTMADRTDTETRLPELPERHQKIMRLAGAEYSFTLSPSERDCLPALLERAEAEMIPAGPTVINQAVEFLAALPSAAMSDDDARMSLQLYRIGLKDMPRDLLSIAVEKAAQKCRWRPTPAELREFVADEMAERQRRLTRLRGASGDKIGRPGSAQISDDERALVIEGMEQLKRDLRAKTAGPAFTRYSAPHAADARQRASRLETPATSDLSPAMRAMQASRLAAQGDAP